MMLGRWSFYRILMPIFMLALVACQPYRAYEGAPLPSSRVATISELKHGPEILITCVDSDDVAWWYRSSFGFPSQISLTPGSHHIMLRYRMVDTYFFGELLVTMEPGRKYLAGGNIVGYSAEFSIVDEATHAVVSSPVSSPAIYNHSIGGGCR